MLIVHGALSDYEAQGKQMSLRTIGLEGKGYTQRFELGTS